MTGAPSSEVAGDVLLAARDVSKTFLEQVALDRVSLELRSGEVHALLGANGSGKSTLIKVLTGVYEPDDGGTLTVDGRDYPLTRAKETSSLHGLDVRVVHQDLGLIDALSIADNIGLVNGYDRHRSGLVDWRTQKESAREVLERFGITGVDVSAPLSSYDKLVQTEVAIARAVAGCQGDKGILILDEPTANLPASGVSRLFKLLANITDAGYGVLYVSHRLAEVFEIAARVTVLRQGRVVHAGPTADLDRDRIIQLMVGHAIASRAYSAKVGTAKREQRLGVESLRFSDSSDLSFSVAESEIVGICGIAGSGHELVCPALVGAAPAVGAIRLAGDRIDLERLDPATAAVLGLAYVPADRLREGLVREMTVADNVTLPILSTMRRFGVFLSQRARTASAEDWVQRVDVQPPDAARSVKLLSGGNQQKVVFARALGISPRVLLLCEPTAGVDVGARDQIWDLLLEAAQSGLAIVLSSTDYDELAALCDRVLVLREGVVCEELTAPGLTETRIASAVLSSHA